MASQLKYILLIEVILKESRIIALQFIFQDATVRWQALPHATRQMELVIARTIPLDLDVILARYGDHFNLAINKQ